MSRGLDSNLVAQAESGHIRILIFVKLEFDGGTLYLHDGVGVYTWADPDDGSQNWLGLGDFGGIGGIVESEKISPFEIQLILSGLDSNLMDEVLNQNYYLRPVTIYLGALNLTTGALVATPNEMWPGFMDTASMNLGNDNSLVITCESEMSIFNKVNGRIYSDADLQSEYAGDLWFKWLPSMVNARVVWRGSTVVGQSNHGAGPGSAGGGGGSRNQYER